MVKDVRNPANHKAARTSAFVKYIAITPFDLIQFFISIKSYEEKQG